MISMHQIHRSGRLRTTAPAPGTTFAMKRAPATGPDSNGDTNGTNLGPPLPPPLVSIVVSSFSRIHVGLQGLSSEEAGHHWIRPIRSPQNSTARMVAFETMARTAISLATTKASKCAPLCSRVNKTGDRSEPSRREG
jgi:hypothetical protein